jgi:hypothetical protein
MRHRGSVLGIAPPVAGECLMIFLGNLVLPCPTCNHWRPCGAVLMRS